MNLHKEYGNYVKWCKSVNTYPIGFVPWKERKFNMTFCRKTVTWIKNE